MVVKAKTAPSSSEITEDTFYELVNVLEGTDHTSGSKLTRLFHYTDAPGLYGILTTNTLWATHYKFLNDNTELRWASTIAKEVLEERRSSEKEGAIVELIDAILGNLDINNYVFDAYLVCLSSKKDSLSQWRAYGKKKGYCIGLDINYMKKIKALCSEHHYFVKVLYDQKQQQHALESSFDKICDILLNVPKDTKPDALGWAQITFESTLSIFSAYFKHPAFEDEAEWRLVLIEPLETLKYRAAQERGIIPYLELDFTKEVGGKIPLRSVRLGPGADRTREGLAVERFTKQSGFPKCPVYYAQAPFSTS